MAALISYQVASRTNPARGPGIELWPRMVPWVQFFLDNYRFLQTLMTHIWLLRHDELYATLMLFCHCVGTEHPQNMSLMVSTPGFRVLAVRAWYSQAGKDIVLDSNDYFAMAVCDVFADGEGISLDEVIEGSDGDLDNFAKLLVRQCDPLIRRHSGSANPLTSKTRFRILRLVISTVVGLSRSASALLYPALVRHGYVKTLTMVMYAFLELPRASLRDLPPFEWDHVKAGVSQLDHLFFLRRAGHELQSSLEAGLLDVLLCCAQADVSDTIHLGSLCAIIAEFLTPSTVYRGVLITMGLAESKTTVSRVIYHEETKKVWTNFTEILARRLAVLNLFDAPGRITQRACDNFECTIIQAKRDLRRCSGCHTAFYCSRECQIGHWNAGHREGCSWHVQRRKSLRLMCTPKEYAFLRFLLRHDWQSHSAAVAVDYVKTQISNPQATLLALFDYAQGHRAFEIQHCVLGGTQHETEDGMEFDVPVFQQVARSGGRMTLAVMRLGNGDKSWTMWLPVRRASPEIPEALKAIVALGDSLTEAEVQEQVEEVMRKEPPNDLIHV
ncbi:hypothetical protein R3P38DRAFT_3259212 [Favolaschia claudopus]|uniref:MYND-type domain-containing protein n=1 Tax=Favolaschia claudopus TaxID=2862362 RepID=A0AAW0D3N0_9AGAR